jgi:glutathione-independent formaldehyde dehydrogenase
VGLLSAYSALLRGAGEVYVVDRVPERLDLAGELGATPVNFDDGDPVEQVRELRRRRGLPIGEEQMDGVENAIDAVGFQALDRDDPSRENPTQVVSDLARLVNPTGHVAIAGVYVEKDLDPATEGRADGTMRVPWGTLFNKGVSVNFGRTHDRRYTTLLRDLIVAGRARPGRIVSHHGSLAAAPGFYDNFDRRADGIVKAVLNPN